MQVETLKLNLLPRRSVRADRMRFWVNPYPQLTEGLLQLLNQQSKEISLTNALIEPAKASKVFTGKPMPV